MDLIWDAAHAGTCYPSSPQVARKFFRDALETLSPDESIPPAPPDPVAWIVPHIDFRVDISTYASVYRQIAQLGTFPETVYILGVGHRCPHDFSLCAGSFRTPLGTVRSNKRIIAGITKSCGLALDRSPESFPGEHSLEFVVIWLQALRDLFFPGHDFQVVPVLLGGLPEHVIASKPPGPRTAYRRFGRALMDSYRDHKATSLIIASIDGCHVGPRFDHDFPADERIQHAVWNWEIRLWQSCASISLSEYYLQLGEIRNGFYFDGVGVLTLLLQNRPLEPLLFSRKLWYEKHDQSFVTFTAGCLRDCGNTVTKGKKSRD